MNFQQSPFEEAITQIISAVGAKMTSDEISNLNFLDPALKKRLLDPEFLKTFIGMNAEEMIENPSEAIEKVMNSIKNKKNIVLSIDLYITTMLTEIATRKRTRGLYAEKSLSLIEIQSNRQLDQSTGLSYN